MTIVNFEKPMGIPKSRDHIEINPPYVGARKGRLMQGVIHIDQSIYIYR